MKDRKRYTRIIPMCAFMYFMALICRNNIGYALDGMSETFQMTATISGLVGGIFFIGYLLLQIPGGNMAQKLSAKKIITYSMVAWSIVSISIGFIQSGVQLIIMRFLLGLSQSMIYPTTLILIGKWFPLKERARAIGYWSIGATISNFVVGPLSGFLVDSFSWRMLFVIEGLPVLLVVPLWVKAIAETPNEAKFLSDTEKEYLLTELKNDEMITTSTSGEIGTWKDALKDKYVWILTIVFVLNNVFNYGLSIWWPQLANSLTGTSYTVVGLLSTIAPLLGLIVMFVVSNHSDKTGERKNHAGMVLVVSGLALLISAISGENPYVAVIFILIAQGIWGGFSPVFWALPPILVGSSIIGVATGLINGVGNLGGFIGPYFFGYLIDKTGNNMVALMFIVVVQLLAGFLLLSLRSPKLKRAQEKIRLEK